jgi:hypothetical protein
MDPCNDLSDMPRKNLSIVPMLIFLATDQNGLMYIRQVGNGRA